MTEPTWNDFWTNDEIPNMIFLHSTNHGCIYSVCEEGELYYAPLYANGSFNIRELEPVDMATIDMDEMEVYDIRDRLIAMSNV